MASEYLLKKAKEEVHTEPVREMTPAEKRKNWWYYHKWQIIAGAVIFVILADILWTSLEIGKVKPDYSIAYVGNTPLSEEAAEALRTGFSAASPDMNGDGKVTVELMQYAAADTGSADDYYYAQAAQVKMNADISQCTSYFFLLEDPEAFQNETGVLCNLDGSLPGDADMDSAGKFVLFGQCTVFSDLDLGIETDRIAALAFARRGFWTDKKCKNADACSDLWDILTDDILTP